MKVLGIDLGTSSSAASVLIGDKIQYIPNPDESRTDEKPFPSIVSFFADGRCLIGTPAREQEMYNPIGTIKNVKRLMGTNKKIPVFGEEYIPQFISALILLKIKLSAEKLLGEELTKAVITVPAYFNDNQKTATREAGKIAGLDVLQILTEPVCASVAFGVNRISGVSRVLVFDMGAGTLDVSIVDAENGVFQVISTTGDTNLGGLNMDEKLEEYLISEFKSQNKLFPNLSETGISQIKNIAESIKIELSEKELVEIDEEIFGRADHKLVTKITRAKFEEMIQQILKRCEKCVDDALSDANISSKEIDKVILVGGATKVPIIKKMITEKIKDPESGVDPSFVVCEGAAIQGAILSNDKNLPVLYQGLTLLPVTAQDIGEEFRDKNGNLDINLMIPKNTTYPCERIDPNFWNNKPMATSAPMDVWQGDFEKYDSNDFSRHSKLAHFMLNNLASGKSNRIIVKYSLDADGILTVTAKEIDGSAYVELDIAKTGESITPAPMIEHFKDRATKFEKKYKRNILSPYEIPVEEFEQRKPDQDNEFCWMCESLEKAKRIILKYHKYDTREFFERSSFRLHIQLDIQYAYGYINLTRGPVYYIGIHNSLKEDTERNKRMLVVVLVHELLHAIHPDWGHDKIRPEEKRLANLGNYFDAIHEMGILFLSGKMSLCNNSMTSNEQYVRIDC